MPDISLSRPPAWNVLAARWRDLEARADGSFFTSWNWVGSRAASRFPHPVLLQAHAGGRLVGLGLFNRRARLPLPARLWLNESGDPALDTIYVEHNGLLMERGQEGAVLPRAIGHLAAGPGHVVLGGVDDAHLAAAQASGALVHRRAHPAASPWIDLDEVRGHPGGHLGLLSANTRQQLRRSLRRYGEAGPLQVRRAASLVEAHAFLEALGRLHQHTWTRRGKPGAFANHGFVAFHADLLAAAWPRGEADLLCIAAGAQPIGYLYNFSWRGRVGNYQSGFDYDVASPHLKPGLTCHHLAVELYAREGAGAYDFLAGEHRYKASLATRTAALHWVEIMPPASLPGLLHRTRAAFARRGRTPGEG